MKFANSYPHNLSLVLGDAAKRFKTTKAMKGFVFEMANNVIYFVHANKSAVIGTAAGSVTVGAADDYFAYAEVEVGKAFNGFRLYHCPRRKADAFLLMEFNLGAESHILKMCEYAQRHGGFKIPETMDEWLVKTIVARLSKFKVAGNYLVKLAQGGKDARQNLYSIESALGLPVPCFVLDAYSDGEKYDGTPYDLVAKNMQGVNVAYNRMIYDLWEGSEPDSHRPGSGFYSIEERLADCEEEELPEEEEEEEDDAEQGELPHYPEADLTDALNRISTATLIDLYNLALAHEWRMAPYVAEMSVGMTRRNSVIDALVEASTLEEPDAIKKLYQIISFDALLAENDRQVLADLLK